MNNTHNDRGQAPENRYEKIEAVLKKAVFPQTVVIESEGIAPERFQATGLHRVELFAAIALASLAHAVVTSRPAAGGTLRPGWARQVAAEAAELARRLDQALDEIERNGDPATETEQ
ncbi:hypothetical protein [Alistipes sp.]|uniref:hypothetical protein n=1 Tax=Alistipes sp. TaxID=1872444 RepID=UPI003AF04472